MSLKVKKDNTKSLLDAIKHLSNDRVYVGIPREKSMRKEPGINNATIAFLQSNGSPANNIPPRPFLIPGVQQAQTKNLDILKKYAKLALSDKDAANKALNSVGLNTQSAVKSYIKNSSNFEPLSQSTIERRQQKGFKGTKPLIRTAQLLNNVSYVIRRK
jgi:hypothetical protein